MCFSGFHPRRSPWLSLLLLWVCVCATVLQKGIKVNEVHPPPFCSEMKETSLSGHSLCVIDMRARACSSEHMLTPEVWEKCLFPFIFLIVKPDRAWMSWIDDPMFMFTLSPQHVLLWCSIKRKSEETKYRRSIWVCETTSRILFCSSLPFSLSTLSRSLFPSFHPFIPVSHAFQVTGGSNRLKCSGWQWELMRNLPVSVGWLR